MYKIARLPSNGLQFFIYRWLNKKISKYMILAQIRRVMDSGTCPNFYRKYKFRHIIRIYIISYICHFSEISCERRMFFAKVEASTTTQSDS